METKVDLEWPWKWSDFPVDSVCGLLRNIFVRQTKRLYASPTSAGAGYSLASVVMLPVQAIFHERHQFRLLLFGHKGVEAGAVCLLLMVQGHLPELRAAHFLIASKTGLMAVLPLVGLSFTGFARHFANRWTSSAFLGICTIFADSLAHSSHYPGDYTEAILTGVGAFLFSVAVSYTPIGAYIERRAEAFLVKAHY